MTYPMHVDVIDLDGQPLGVPVPPGGEALLIPGVDGQPAQLLVLTRLRRVAVRRPVSDRTTDLFRDAGFAPAAGDDDQLARHFLSTWELVTAAVFGRIAQTRCGLLVVDPGWDNGVADPPHCPNCAQKPRSDRALPASRAAAARAARLSRGLVERDLLPPYLARVFVIAAGRPREDRDRTGRWSNR